MSYLIFARKFRPQQFDDVVGQEHITTTLKNSIERNRIAQSFLFSGPRGVGKTSTARILAKALNCAKGPSENPCNQCAACDEITRGNSLDVLEIDGASNRGIDEIRTLRENVKLKPASGRFRIYIIDEVHMLTGEAFNALLKTLEEPPEHVKFIFATTEPHKVPLTILSRCQRFSFRRIKVADIHATLKSIAKKEKIKTDDKTLFLIAKSAEGSLRDGEGLLDQLSSFGGGEVKEEEVLAALGFVSGAVYSQCIKAIRDRNASEILGLIHELVEHGKDVEQFLKGLMEQFRDVLVLKLGDMKKEWVEQDEETAAELRELSNVFGREELFFILSLLQHTVRELRWAKSPRFMAEMCLLKIAHRGELKSIEELLKDLKSMEGGRSKNESPSYGLPNDVNPDKKKDRSYLNPSVFPSSNHKKNEVETNIAKPSLPPVESAAVAFTLNDAERIWPDLLAQVKAAKMSIGMFLSEAEPVEASGNRITFGFPEEFRFHKETIEQLNNRQLIQNIAEKILKAPVIVEFVLTQADVVKRLKLPEETPAPDSDIIISALEIFDGSKVIHKN